MAAARRMRRRGWMNAARKATQPEAPQPAVRHLASRPGVSAPAPDAQAYIFDVEGTLVDTVLPSLNCWCRTLAEFGFCFRTADLHRYSGMDGKEVLARLLPEGAELREFILTKYNWHFRTEVLPTIRAVPGARDLIATLKSRGAKIALATTCGRDELAQYRACLGADDCIDAFVSGEDVRRGKPHPDVVMTALKRLDINPSEAVFIGDTPYDAEAARQARVRSFGMLSGHFPRADLLGAGCSAIFLDPKSMNQALSTPEAA
jgi:HAD superfamily hydrolase (TIGR01509 family)